MNLREAQDPCGWYGVVCDVNSTTLLSLNLSNNLLHGSHKEGSYIGQLSQLSTLTSVDLSFNHLKEAPLPDLTSLTNLVSLNLSSSFNLQTLPLTLPTSIELLDVSDCGLIQVYLSPYKSLTSLHLDHNSLLQMSDLEGVERLPHLRVLDISSNAMRGSVHLKLFRLDALYLDENQLVLEIPPFCNLSRLSFRRNGRADQSTPRVDYCERLVWLDLSSNLYSTIPLLNGTKNLQEEGNQLSGSLPDITKMYQLSHLDVKRNHFTGVIDDMFHDKAELNYVDLSFNHLEGSLPPSLFHLTSLRYLSLNRNKLRGEISNVTHLLSLKYLDVSFNNFSGSVRFPPNLVTLYAQYNLLEGQLIMMGDRYDIINVKFNRFSGKFPSLSHRMSFFDATSNQFNGSITSRIAVERIFLDDNQLTGDLPTMTEDVVWFSADNNDFRGTLDPLRTILRRCGYISIRNNSLRGDLEIFMLPSRQLVYLDLSDNYLSGPVFGDEGRNLDWYISPDRMDNLVHIDLSHNEFKCQIFNYPVYRHSLPPRLIDIILSNNRFYGRPFLGDSMQTLFIETIMLDNNNISGDAIDTMSLESIRTLSLANNSIEGEITSYIGYADQLTYLDLSGNRLYGRLPDSTLQGMTSLQKLDLSRNRLECYDLKWLNDLIHLEYLDLSQNKIHAKFPYVGDMKNLKFVDMSHNRLYDDIDPSFFRLVYLDSVSLSHNELTGSIKRFHGDPRLLDLSWNLLSKDLKFISYMSAISVLQLNNNRFSGNIPPISGRRYLEQFDASNNNISGDLEKLEQLPSLLYINLSNNRINGSLPEISNDINFRYIDLSRNNISIAKQSIPFRPSTLCRMSDNPLRCPIDWDIITRCGGQCESMGKNEEETLVYHMMGEVSDFIPRHFVGKLSHLSNITQRRIEVRETRSGSVIATIAIKPPNDNELNQGSVEDSIGILKSIDRDAYHRQGIDLIDDLGWVPTDAPSYPVGKIVGIAVGGVVLLLVIIGVAFFFKLRRIRRDLYMRQYALVDICPDVSNAAKKTRVDYEELKHMKMIGSGAFGVVYRAKWRGTKVAIKTEQVTTKQFEEFVHEVCIIQNLKSHPNIVMFIGMSFPPQPLSLITEYCEGGSLFIYLRQTICCLELKIRFMREIALGMLHLHKEKIIHRDLAVRNILLSQSLQVKVADFGLSREQGNTDGASQTQSTIGPVKWMAPEAIRDRFYSTKSDVFSFGVVIWEILEIKEPFADDYNLITLAAQIIHGRRLDIPTESPAHLSELMRACWMEGEGDRPDFEEIVAHFKEGVGEDCRVERTTQVQYMDMEVEDVYFKGSAEDVYFKGSED
ncbi:putative leucine-rich repeat receptor-like protein kinase [Planoprotostelium fungivorum]|uniref:Putative leucine-rich repeat receptor-like protein kinase n=1 Tax=Planoprotostelium fungivorum TaxID=1890364 RepID=A0A2P6NFA6_9EUKA|nr:putative leucine-rich repeat receptor-like protein kinase [Planoprotostelium fungivorum]